MRNNGGAGEDEQNLPLRGIGQGVESHSFKFCITSSIQYPTLTVQLPVAFERFGDFEFWVGGSTRSRETIEHTNDVGGSI